MSRRVDDKREKRPDKAVPLVIYKGGERIVIGSAYLKGDGRVEGQIQKDVKQELKDMLFGNTVGDISINPKQSIDIDKHHLISSTEARTIVGLPPKDQES